MRLDAMIKGWFTACLLAAPAAATGAEPLAFWQFGTEETTRLEAVGGVHRDQPGPRPPAFPDFPLGNTAVRFDGQGSRFTFSDPGDNSRFDFSNGDAITLESWVNISEMKKGENLYIVGKGRTHNPAYPKDNQNWALRVREVNGTARVSFLFASQPSKENPGLWHRWTSSDGIKPGSGWHHVAVTYTFGEPNSATAWIDGKKQLKGEWDMGGATVRQPVVDNDAIWIGSSMGGSPSNSFRGLLDDLGIHRGRVADQVMAGRYRRVGPEENTLKVDLLFPSLQVRGSVALSLHEGWNSIEYFPQTPAELGQPALQIEQNWFLFPRLPLRYDSWGIRDSWLGTVTLRASASIDLPKGKHSLLVRSKGASRMWLDGKLIATTPVHSKETGGHEALAPVPVPPEPLARPCGYGDKEKLVEIQSSGGIHQVVFESLVGGKKFRHDTGECCLAIRLEGDKHFRILAAGKGDKTASLDQGKPAPFEEIFWLTDAGWEKACQEMEKKLTQVDDRNRRKLASSRDAYWAMRAVASREWARMHPGPKVPSGIQGLPSNNEVDQFLNQKMQQARGTLVSGGEKTGTAHEALDILRENCFRCHGEKVKGGLKLFTRESALRAGNSGKLAIVPGQTGKSNLLARIDPKSAEPMPPSGKPLTPGQIAVVEKWIGSGAQWPSEPLTAGQIAPAPLTSDSTFLRRVFLDVVGLPPSPEEIRAFLNDTRAEKRNLVIDRLLADQRFAGHWVSYWQDVLAENPNILKPTLNNTGPFRFFILDALKDDKPLDRFVTELVMMRGNSQSGGSAGFGMAADNDVPMAAKAHILGTAFLGVEMQCARCHDSPFHSTRQKDLFQISAMLERKQTALPKSSTVPAGFFEKKARESLIKASLKPGEKISPVWPFPEISPNQVPPQWLADPNDSREKFAAILVSPANQRFARVLVNRFWKKLLGAGLVEPAWDWENKTASHAELLDWLARELVRNEYRLKPVLALILKSHAYQREPVGNNLASSAERRFFNAPDRRRLSGEQVVDSLFSAASLPMKVEEITFDPDSRQAATTMISLGFPQRAWEFTSLSNERDRPSLALPRAQAVIDVLEAFGWRGARQNPATDRESAAQLVQPAILSNGTLASWIARLSEENGLTRAAVEAKSPGQLSEDLFLRFLGRMPSAEEQSRFLTLLDPGFFSRNLLEAATPAPPPRLPRISWTNHLVDESTRVKLEMEKRARAGSEPSRRLDSAWRERTEDAVWSLFNLPEFVWMP